MIAKNRKGNNMSNGLLAMYIFLAVFATGLVIYSKWGISISNKSNKW